MRRLLRRLGVLGLAPALLVGALVPLAPTAVRAAASTCSTPAVTATGTPAAPTAQHGPGGTTWRLTGSGFDFFNQGSFITPCKRLDVQIGGQTVASFTTASAAITAQQIDFTPSRVASGPIRVVLTDSSGSANQSNADLIMVTDPTGGSGTYTPTVGQRYAVAGGGLTLGNQVTAAFVGYNGGTGCPAMGNATVSSDQALSVPALGAYCHGSISLTENFHASATDPNAVATLGPIPLGAVNVAPGSTSLSAPDATAGSAIVVNGSGFGNSGSATLAGRSVASRWSDTQVSVTMPDDGASGDLQLTRADGARIDAGTVSLDARIDNVSPGTAVEGDTVTISGGGLSQSGSLIVGGVHVTAASWSPKTITFAVPRNPGDGTIQLAPASTSPPRTAPHLTITVRIAGVDPASPAPGDAIQVTGVGFGTRTGTVNIGGIDATVVVWGDQQVVAQVPSAASPGTTTLILTPPGLTGGTTSLTIAAPSGPGGGGGLPGGLGTSSSSTTTGGSATPAPSFIAPAADGQPQIVTGPVAFVRPEHKPQSPVNLTLDSQGLDAAPGHDIPFTATLIAFGKPVAGANVTLSLVVVPGTDASVDPATAITDERGQIHGVVHLSRTPGDHILLARSGTTSDEIRLSGRVANAAANVSVAGDQPVAAAPPKLLIMSALILCLVLFLSGFAIQLLLPRWAAAHGGAVPVTASGRPFRPRLPGAALVDASMAFAGAAQFAAVALLIGPLLLVARLRRRR